MANYTILVVDDDIVVLAALSRLLNVFGYIVSGASNSQAAMDYVTNSSKRFDLIITDLAMPGIDGVQFMTEAKKVFPDIPVIVMTGYSERCTPEEALRLGAFAYVAKPFNVPEVVSTIERALRPSAKTASRPRSRPSRETLSLPSNPPPSVPSREAVLRSMPRRTGVSSS